MGFPSHSPPLLSSHPLAVPHGLSALHSPNHALVFYQSGPICYGIAPAWVACFPWEGLWTASHPRTSIPGLVASTSRSPPAPARARPPTYVVISLALSPANAGRRPEEKAAAPEDPGPLSGDRLPSSGLPFLPCVYCQDRASGTIAQSEARTAKPTTRTWR